MLAPERWGEPRPPPWTWRLGPGRVRQGTSRHWILQRAPGQAPSASRPSSHGRSEAEEGPGRQRRSPALTCPSGPGTARRGLRGVAGGPGLGRGGLTAPRHTRALIPAVSSGCHGNACRLSWPHREGESRFPAWHSFTGPNAVMLPRPASGLEPPLGRGDRFEEWGVHSDDTMVTLITAVRTR